MGSETEVIKYRDYGIQKLDFIRQALAGYAGGSAIISEMLQNADDAGASSAMFQFRTKDLIAWNNSVFSEKDWKNLTSIASGGKRNEEGKIGTWGTGFLSVFHITDIPEVNSAGEKLILDPREERAAVLKSDIKDGSGFRMTWRREPSLISQEIEADIWSDEDIQALKNDLAVAIYRQIIFLRNVSSIEVYEGEKWKEKLVYRVTRTKILSEEHGIYSCERWEIEYQRTGVPLRVDTWLYFRSQVPQHLLIEGVKPKDTEIGIAFPLENREWLVKNMPGTLYNFLPTPIQTGYSFQINGAFFPDNNRRTILLDIQTQREKSHWNINVIKAVSNLFTEIITDIRDQLVEPRRFYELLPTQPSFLEFLNPIHENFCQAAPNKKIVLSSLGEWLGPGKVTIGQRGSSLAELVSAYIHVVPTGTPQTFRDFLSDKLKIHILDWKDVINFLRAYNKPGLSLSDAHPMINSLEKLRVLYNELPNTPTEEQRALLANISLCLGEDGNLWPFSACIWRATEDTRSLLINNGLLFIPIDVQKQFPRLFESMVPEMRGAELVEWLGKQHWPQLPIRITCIPPFLENLDHVSDLLKYIYEDLYRTNREILRRLPIVYTEDCELCSAESNIYFHRDAAERSELQLFGLRFVHPDWASCEEIRAVYERAGIRDLAPRNLIQSLQENPLHQAELSTEELVNRLKIIYGYLYRNRSSIDEVSKNHLQALPLCLTQHNRLVSVHEEKNGLYLPGEETLSRISALRSLDKLELDHLVHSETLSGRNFLTQILGIRPLSEIGLIREIILKYYKDYRLNNNDRFNLLSFVSEQLRVLPAYQYQDLWPELRATKLILCSDGEYHTGQEVYFATPAIEAVFGSGYLKVHSDYQLPVPSLEDEDQSPYRQNIWYWLFDNLGVNETPSVSDLVKAIERLTRTNPPEDAKIEAVRRLYDFLNSEISENKSFLNSPALQRLAEIPWLPARNRKDRWYYPKEIYQASMVYLIGDQAPLLLFRESREQLRSVLGMPRYPEVTIVANHLIDLAARKKPLEENDLRIYQDLGNRWHDLSSHLQRNLRTIEVVWSPSRKKYWKADQVFFGNYSHLFGNRRAYLQPPGGDAQKFLSYLGIREEPHSYNDSLDLLGEVAQDYLNNTPIREDDHKLVYTNLFHLSLLENQQIYDRLKKLKFMPADDGLLYEPSQIALIDRKDLLRWFEGIHFPCLDVETLTEPVYKLLRKAGTPLISELIYRELVKVEGQQSDTALNNQIPQLKVAFQRVVLGTYKGDEEAQKQAFQDIDLLVNMEILSCQQIVVQYSLKNQENWDVPGHTNSDEKSLLDRATNRLYVHRENKKLDYVQLALEIENLLFPTGKESITIELLLEKKLAEIDDFLDRHGYPAILDQRIVPPVLPVQGGMDDWAIPTEPAGEMEKNQAASTESPGAAGLENQPGETLGEPKPEEEITPFSQESPFPVPLPSTEVSSVPGEEIEFPCESVPAFSGSTRPTVPVLRNDYESLNRHYGLEQTSPEEENNILNSDHYESDQTWLGDNRKEGETVTIVRFTLSYMNRYNGFLPLHPGAKQMLADSPSILICQTDFPEWEFDLYVDYEKQILYNQQTLPQFFDAFNIPAGGIIYLERVHSNHCRIFWKQASYEVKNVICLELLEDGILDEYEIPAAQFPCELSEYIFRSEKRLEDSEALFRQAIGKKGVFHTICDVFGEPGRILSFDEIFHGVMKIRQVAQASIHFQLNSRPCFTKLEDGRWKFEPQLGANKRLGKEKGWEQKEEPSFPQGATIPSPSTAEKTIPPAMPGIEDFGPNSLLIAIPEAIINFSEDMQKGWIHIGDLLKRDNGNTREGLQEIIREMLELAARWQEKLQTLTETDIPLDDTLKGLWERSTINPRDPKNFELLELRVGELAKAIPMDPLKKQLKTLLARTPESVQPVFHRSLSKLASQAFECELFELSLHLYELLQSLGAGDFSDRIGNIQKQKKVQEKLEAVKQEKASGDRLILYQIAWSETPDFPTLRRAIQEEVGNSITEEEQLFRLCLDEGQINEAYKQFAEWLNQIIPLFHAWKTDVRLSAKTCELARELFTILLSRGSENGRIECFYQAFHVVNLLPLDVQNHIPIVEYFHVLNRVAEDYEKKTKLLESAALIEFGIFTIEKSHRALERSYNYQILEFASRLCEQLGFLGRAYNYLFKANRYALNEQKIQNSRRLYSLQERMNFKPDEAMKRDLGPWCAELKSLCDKKEYMEWIDPINYQAFLDHLLDSKSELEK